MSSEQRATITIQAPTGTTVIIEHMKVVFPKDESSRVPAPPSQQQNGDPPRERHYHLVTPPASRQGNRASLEGSTFESVAHPSQQSSRGTRSSESEGQYYIYPNRGGPNIRGRARHWYEGRVRARRSAPINISDDDEEPPRDIRHPEPEENNNGFLPDD